MSPHYRREKDFPVSDYISVLSETTLGPGRPLLDRDRVAAMLAGSNFIVAARDDTGRILGLARCISDGAWICYCADLAVRSSHQGQGIGRGLIATCRELLGSTIGFILVSEPVAVPFYRALGMEEYSAFFYDREVA